ncbi:hypothetical protein QFC24_003740 [Naganishia onofrii]|uniref:Uncharacterized protein n=1 Tax=Naganishia onofrii TaxID=1851511 RepID=A0ACC2XJG8_9TREE|nr:hypothetical protein QFC24_003740 [Naganishia onofrii]
MVYTEHHRRQKRQQELADATEAQTVPDAATHLRALDSPTPACPRLPYERQETPPLDFTDSTAGAIEPTVVDGTSDLAALLFENSGANEPEQMIAMLQRQRSPGPSGIQKQSTTPQIPSCLRHLPSPIWLDFINDYVECTRSLDFSLLSSGILTPISRDTPNLSVVEHVIYGTSVALVAQWNMPHSAIQSHMTQAWNIFQHGLMLGRLSSADTISSTSVKAQQRMISQETATPAVRTLRSAERHLALNYTDALVVHAACSNVLCQNVFHQYRNASEFKVGSRCGVCRSLPDGERNLGLVPFLRMPLANVLEGFLRIQGMEELCEDTLARKQRDADFDARTYPALKIYREAYDGTAWNFTSITGESIAEPSHFVLRLNIGLDWYQPHRSNHARQQSVGPIIGHVANLPARLRGSMKLALLFGITPGK